MRKGTPNGIFRAEFQELVNKKYINLHRRVREGRKLGYAVVTDQQLTRRRIRDQSSIFSAEQKTIIDAL
jgi:hypothetical protein